MSPDRYEELMSHLYAATRGEMPPPVEGEGGGEDAVRGGCTRTGGMEWVVEVDLWLGSQVLCGEK